MRFDEAREKFRELEAQFFSGDLTEGDFLDGVAQLRVNDGEGREWAISARNGRWLVHDGRQWVFAEPPQKDETPGEAAEEPSPEPVVPREPLPQPKPKPARPPARPRAQAPGQAPNGTPSPAVTGRPGRKPPVRQRLRLPLPTSRALTTILTALLVVACLVGAGVSAWVLFLRDLGEPETISLSGEPSSLVPVETYTPRPATPTYTPTATPTPSRTSTPTITPQPTDTPPTTNTPRATSTPRPTLPPTSTETAPPTAPAAPTARTHTVAAGETLSEIAAQYGISTDALAQANGIANPALIRQGQVLIIPAPGATPTWTPIVLATASPTRATRTPTAASTATRKATASVTAPATRRPTKTPPPKATATPKPAALSGKIAYTVWNAPLGKYELFVRRVDGSGRNLLGQGYRQPQFRQDGNMLAANGDGKPNYEHLVRMDSNGGGLIEISNFAEDGFPTWSPEGDIVAFSSLAWGDGQSRLGIVHDIYGKNQNWIRIGTTEIRGDYPFWMTDGRVVYHGCAFLTDHAACGLFWVAAGGGDYHRLTTDSSDTAPAGSGSRVAFMSLRDGDWEVYTVNMDGSNLKQLTDNSAQDGLPTWSPDGRAIAFVSDRSGSWAIWVMDANGQNQRKLFDLGGGYGPGDRDWLHERISWAP